MWVGTGQARQAILHLVAEPPWEQA
jgi:hypothetical protein